MYKFIFTLLCCILMLTSYAQTTPKNTVHTIVKGESLYSLSKKYHVSIESIARLNSSTAETMKFKIGQKIKIPASSVAKPPVAKEKEVAKSITPPPSTKTTSSPQEVSTKSSYHTIAKGESIYSIAKLYGYKTAEILAANNMKADAKIKIGQHIYLPTRDPEAIYIKPIKDSKPNIAPPKDEKVEIEQKKYIPIDDKPLVERKPEPVKKAEDSFVVRGDKVVNIPTPKERKKEETPSVSKKETAIKDDLSPNDYESVFNNPTKADAKKVVYRGIGSFLNSESTGNQYLALYNYADMGTILKVTNLMSKQSIYVKVIGKVSSTDAQNEILLKVSSQAAEHLKVKEDKFLVEVTSYTSP